MFTKFTIVVPTRERAMPLHFCLKNLLKQDYDNYNILVSDNYSNDDTYAVVHAFHDSRIRYVNTGKRLSMSDNWEFALSHVIDGWVLFVGDDDGLLPSALSVLNKVILETSCEALSTTSCSYWWPNHFELKPKGELTIPFPVTSLYKIKQSAVVLDLVMRGLKPYRELPWLYNGGASSVDLINRLRRFDGKFFCSFNPDIYSAVSMALGTLTYASISVPIAINGASKFSNGTSSMLGELNKAGSPNSIMMKEDNIPFHPDLELGKSFQILVYESYSQASHLYAKLIYKMPGQIKTSLIVSPRSDFLQVLTQCQIIAKRNNISMPRLEWIMVNRKFFQLYTIYRRLTQRRAFSIPASDLEAFNIDIASDAASYIYRKLEYISSKSYLDKVFFHIFIFVISLVQYSRRIFK